MTRARSLLVAATLLAAGCEEYDNHLAPRVYFVDAADATHPVLPLDAVDGFPVRVRVCTPAPGINDGTLGAHVWIAAGVGAQSVSMGMTDATLTLERVNVEDAGFASAEIDPRCGAADAETPVLEGIVTLNAPGPGAITVNADVAGHPAFGTASVGAVPPGGAAPFLAIAAIPLSSSSNGVPRFAVCVETPASKGTIDLTADDTQALGAMGQPLSGTLVPGPCALPPVAGGFGASATHVNFDVSFAPPFTLFAALRGRPISNDPLDAPALWSVAYAFCSAQVNLGPPTPAAPTNVTSGTTPGLLYTVSTQATWAVSLGGAACTDGGVGAQSWSPPVVGMNVTFSSPSSGLSITPATVPTNASGVASSYVFVPLNARAVLEAQGGGVLQALLFNDAPADGSAPIALTTPVFIKESAGGNPDAGADGLDLGTLSGGVLYKVTTVATGVGADGGAAVPLFGAQVSFSAVGGAAVTFTPATATTNAAGVATSYALLPYNSQVLVEVASGVAFAAAPSPPTDSPIKLAPLSHDTGTPVGTNTAYVVTATLSDASGAPARGVTVSFAAVAAGAIPGAQQPSIVTNAQGQASIVVVVATTPVLVAATALNQVQTIVVP